VEDARGEADPGGREGVAVRDLDRELELGALVGRALGAAHKGGPGPEVGLVGEGELDAIGGVRGGALAGSRRAVVGVEAAGRGCAGVLFVFLTHIYLFFFEEVEVDVHERLAIGQRERVFGRFLSFVSRSLSPSLHETSPLLP